MRCLACDCALTDFEATRKTESGFYIDLCNKCFYSGVDEVINPVVREDLEGEYHDIREHSSSE
jgi:hypothetical protein